MPDDPRDDWFSEEESGSTRKLPRGPSQGRPGGPPLTPEEQRRRLAVAGLAALFLVVLVILVIVAATGDGESGDAGPVASGPVITSPPADTTTAPPTDTTATGTTPATPGAGLPATGPLRVGDEGDEVLALQQALVELGFDPGEPDGAYGPQTAEAVSQFQQQQGLAADGVAGAETLEALRNALASSQG